MNKRVIWSILPTLLIGPAFFYFAVGYGIGGHADAPIYLIMAEWFSGDRSAHVEIMMQQSVLPPFYPLSLALLGQISDVSSAHILILVYLLCSMFLFSAWLGKQSDHFWTTLLPPLWFLLLPVTWMQSLELLSEPLYLLLCMASLVLFDHVPTSKNRSVLLLLLLPLSALLITRTAGWSLWVAMFFVLIHHRDWGSAAILWFALIPALLWRFYKELMGFEGHYATPFFLSFPTGYAWLTEQLHGLNINFQAMMAQFGRLFSFLGSQTLVTIGSTFCLIALLEWLKRLIHWKVDAIYLLFYLVILLIWPYPDHMDRFLWPVFPFVLFYGVSLLSRITETISGRLWQSIIMATLLLCVLPELGDILARWREGQRLAQEGTIEKEYTQTIRWYTRRTLEDAQRDATQRQNLELLIKKLNMWVPENDCVYFMRPPDIMFLADRPSFEPPRLINGKLDQLLCPWLLVSSFTHPAAPEVFYPLMYLDKNRIKNVFFTENSLPSQVNFSANRSAMLIELFH